MTLTGNYLQDREQFPLWWSNVYFWYGIKSAEEDKVKELLADAGKENNA